MMGKRIMLGLLTAFLGVALFGGMVRAEDRRVLRCRVLARDFMSELKGELKAAIRDEGLAGAIAVCREAAPELAARYSLLPGISLGRTALRCRNPENRPDAWEKKGLEIFEKRRLEGEILAGMEYWQELDAGGKKVFRYLRAIPTGSVCLQCHGEKLSPKIKKALRRFYPGDRAVGFRLGELRGAVTITLSP